MSSSQLILPVLTSAIGVAVSFVLLILLNQQKEKDRGIKVGMLLGAVVLTFFTAFFAAAILNFEKVPRTSFAWQASAVVLAISAAVLPSLVIWSWRSSSVLKWRSQHSKTLLNVSWCCSGAVILFVLLKPGLPEVAYLNQVIGVSSLVCFTPAIISILRLPLEPRLGLFMRVTCFLYLASAFLSLFIPAWNSKPSPFLLFLAFLRFICLLTGIVGSFMLSARFRFADVFVTWSSRLTITGILTMAGALVFSASIEPTFATNSLFVQLTFALLVGGLMLIGNWTIARYEHWLTSHVLRRVDLESALKSVRSILSSAGERDLLTEIETILQQTLRADGVCIVEAAAVPKDVLDFLKRGETTELPMSMQPLTISNQGDVEVIAPVLVNRKTPLYTCISPGTRRRALLSSEVQFVEDVVQQLGLRLHQVQMEAATRRQAIRESLLREQLTEAELRALRAQINPHFLFNSLNTIADLIVRDPANAERMTVRLSQVFRYVLTHSNKQFVTLGEEFAFLRQYLDIEQERFGTNLHVSLDVHPDADHVSIPSLLLQPLVENAMKHGLAPMGGLKQISLRAGMTGTRVHVEICDNGVGFAEAVELVASDLDAATATGVGLANTFARLRTVYGDDAEMRVQSAPMQGCKISISFAGERERCDV